MIGKVLNKRTIFGFFQQPYNEEYDMNGIREMTDDGRFDFHDLVSRPSGGCFAGRLDS